MKKIVYSLLLVFSFITFKLSGQVAFNVVKLGNLTYNTGFPWISSLWGYTEPSGNEWALVGAPGYMSIVDLKTPTIPTEKFRVPCTNSIWHEIKTYDHYAYMVSDNTSDGLIIVDLQYLPDSVKTYKWLGNGTNIKFDRAHTLVIDDKGYLYLNGGRNNIINGTEVRGTIICDLKPNPLVPTYVGNYNIRYVHDSYVRGDTMWTAEIYDGYASVIDISDRTHPVKLTDFQTEKRFTHNTALSDDSKTLYTTDEVKSSSVGAYDVSNLSDITLLSSFKNKPTSTSIVHNVHVFNDFLVMSYYRDGVLIADAYDPEMIVKSGWYDTNPGTGEDETGCWEVYPYFPSGIAIASDMEKGLFVLKPNYLGAAIIKGDVTDSTNSLPLQGVNVQIVSTTNTFISDIDGKYKMGQMDTGLYAIKFTKNGYKDVTINNIDLERRKPVYLHVAMEPGITGIENAFNPLGIKILQNPVKDKLSVNIPRISGSNLEYHIFDLTGKDITSGNLQDAKVNEINDLSVLSAGSYILNIVDSGSRIFSGIFDRF